MPRRTPPPDFWLEVHVGEHMLLLRLHGDLDLVSVAEVERTIAAHRPSWRLVVLDLSGLDFMDSSGLRLILELQTRPQGSGFAFVAPTGAVARLMEVAGVATLINWVADPAPHDRGSPL